MERFFCKITFLDRTFISDRKTSWGKIPLAVENNVDNLDVDWIALPNLA